MSITYSLYIITILVLSHAISNPEPDTKSYIHSLSDLHHLQDRNEPLTKSCEPFSEFQCVSTLHGTQCIPNEQRCDGQYQCKDQSDERHCLLSYVHKEFAAKCHNQAGSYAPYALVDIFDNKLKSGEISVAPKDYLECNVQLRNVTNLDMIKFIFEGVGSYAQMVSSNIQIKLYYLQANRWIPVNATYYDQDSTQLTTTFITKRNERGVYTNNIKFKLYNLPPKENKNYKFVKNEFLHIVDIRFFANNMPFYCPTNLVKKWSMFQKQVAEWKYIETWKICNSVPDCIDGSDEIFCDHDGLKHKNKKVSLGKLLNKKMKGVNKNGAVQLYNGVSVVLLIVSLLYSVL
eukprot:488064_1